LQDGRAALGYAHLEQVPRADCVFGFAQAFLGRRKPRLRGLLLFPGHKKAVVELVHGKDDIIFRPFLVRLRHLLVGSCNSGGFADFEKLRQRLGENRRVDEKR